MDQLERRVLGKYVFWEEKKCPLEKKQNNNGKITDFFGNESYHVLSSSCSGCGACGAGCSSCSGCSVGTLLKNEFQRKTYGERK